MRNCSVEVEKNAGKAPNAALVPDDASIKSSVDEIPEKLHFESVSDLRHTFLALGDSYTIGESVNLDQRWYIQLIDFLKKAGIQVQKSDVIAQTGWTTAELISAIKASGNTEKYSIVSLLIGVNNQYRGQSIDTYGKEFKQLLDLAINFVNGKKHHVMVLSIPDWGVTPFGMSNGDPQKIAQEVKRFNQVAQEACVYMGIKFLDTTEISKAAQDHLLYVANDGLHFSGKMYQLWAKQAFPVARKILSE